MKFEFDQNKSASNLMKHGIDFIKAQQFWKDGDIAEFPLNTEDEQRFIVVGKIDSKYWSAIITYRQARIRLISVRRSRDKEIENYEKAND
ncbi:MAG: BrnT family toxin [Cyanobacteria bacterium P01_A01_bin.116]